MSSPYHVVALAFANRKPTVPVPRRLYRRAVPSLTNQSMFEALFERRLKPTGVFAEELKSAGYDASRVVAKYPTEVWRRCLDIARRHRWPELDEPDAFRHIGHEFTEGFLETIAGRLVGAALPFMSPGSFLKRLASYFRMGREDAELTFDIVELAPLSARVVVHNPAAVPGTFVAGMIDVMFERLSQQGTVEVLQKTPVDYELFVRWQ